jgi:hypothetical protein
MDGDEVDLSLKLELEIGMGTEGLDSRRSNGEGGSWR